MKGRKPSEISKAADALTRAPSAPGWLSSEAKAEWKRVAPGLVARRILSTTDLGQLENYCLAIGRVRQIESKLQLAFDPVLARLQDKALASARQLAAELGLTPVSRSKAALVGDGDDAPAHLD